MEYLIHSFRHSHVLLQEPEFVNEYRDIIEVINGITEQDLIYKHNSYGIDNHESLPKSLSRAINDLLKQELINKNWTPESGIFQDNHYQGDTWRLDFAKNNISIEVGFNHSSVIAWNLIKPVLASELNHVKKAIQTKIGVIITATESLKSKGGFDNAIGTFEKYKDYLLPLNNILTVPLLIIGLEAPKSFLIVEEQFAPRKKIGKIHHIN